MAFSIIAAQKHRGGPLSGNISWPNPSAVSQFRTRACHHANPTMIFSKNTVHFGMSLRIPDTKPLVSHDCISPQRWKDCCATPSLPLSAMAISSSRSYSKQPKIGKRAKQSSASVTMCHHVSPASSASWRIQQVVCSATSSSKQSSP